MGKKATRLGVNFFNTSSEIDLHKSAQNSARKSVRDLIIELDKALADFVGSRMFTNPTVVDAAENGKAETNLDGLIKLCAALNVEAAKMVKTPN